MTRGGGRPEVGEWERKRRISRRLLWIAPRSTRATVGLVICCWPFRTPPLSSTRRPPPSRHSLREVLEARVFLDECELDGADRPVALLADDDLGRPLGLGVRVSLGVAVLLLAEDEHDDVGVLLEGPGLAQVGQLRAMVGTRL